MAGGRLLSGAAVGRCSIGWFLEQVRPTPLRPCVLEPDFLTLNERREPQSMWGDGSCRGQGTTSSQPGGTRNDMLQEDRRSAFLELGRRAPS